MNQRPKTQPTGHIKMAFELKKLNLSEELKDSIMSRRQEIIDLALNSKNSAEFYSQSFKVDPVLKTLGSAPYPYQDILTFIKTRNSIRRSTPKRSDSSAEISPPSPEKSPQELQEIVNAKPGRMMAFSIYDLHGEPHYIDSEVKILIPKDSASSFKWTQEIAEKGYNVFFVTRQSHWTILENRSGFDSQALREFLTPESLKALWRSHYFSEKSEINRYKDNSPARPKPNRNLLN
jgi:hypothetical protein